MATRAFEKLMTAEDLLKLPDDGSTLYELDRGRLVCMCPASLLSSVVAGRILAALTAFVARLRLGVVAGADGGYRLVSGPDTLRAPDVSFVRRERLPGGRLRPGFFAGAPDLAVEVLSPSDRYADVTRKVGQYFAAGTRLVWVVDPAARTAVVFHPGVSPVTLDPDGALDGEDVVPGFRLPLVELWEDLADEDADEDNGA